MLVFVMLAKALRGGGRETHAAFSVVVRKGRKMLKQAAKSLFAEMAVHTHGCHASPAVRQEGQPPKEGKKPPSCHCSDKSPKGTLGSHSAPRMDFCVHSLTPQHSAQGLPSSQEQLSPSQGGRKLPCSTQVCSSSVSSEGSQSMSRAEPVGNVLPLAWCVLEMRGGGTKSTEGAVSAPGTTDAVGTTTSGCLEQC